MIIQASATPKKFYCFPNIDDAEDYISTHASQTMSFSEIGIATKDGRRAIKPFVDFEWYPERTTHNSSTDIFEVFLLPRLIMYLEHTYGLRDLQRKDFLFFPMDRADKTKISFHAVLDRQIFFRSMKDHEVFMKGFKLYVEDLPTYDDFAKLYLSCIDTTVYGKEDFVNPTTPTQKKVFFQLRLPLCSREGRMKKIPAGAKFADCLVLRYKEVARLREGDEFYLEQVINHTNPPVKNKDASLWVPMNKEQALSLAMSVLPYDKSALEMSDKFHDSTKMVMFKRKQNREIDCIICGKQHKSLAPFAYFSGDFLKFNCHSNCKRRRNRPKIIFPFHLTTDKKDLNPSRLIDLKGKVVDYRSHRITFRTLDQRIYYIKGGAVIEMLCPLFQWDITVLADSSASDGAHLLHSVNAVKLLALRKDHQWDKDGWKHLNHVSVKNLFIDYRLATDQAIEYCQRAEGSVQEYIKNCPDFSLKNLWYTEAYLLRLCNDYPDSYRVNNCPFISQENVYDVLLFVRCAELFDSPVKMSWLLDNISITEEFKQYAQSAEDYNEQNHGTILQLCQRYQDILRIVAENKGGDQIVARMMDKQTAQGIAKLMKENKPKLMACSLPAMFAGRVGLTEKDGEELVLFYLQQNHTSFLSLQQFVTNVSKFKLLHDEGIMEHLEGDPSPFSFDQTQQRYLFPKQYSSPPTINDTVRFVNDIALRSSQYPGASIRCNVTQCWNHFRVLWELAEAQRAGTLEEWKDQQLCVENVFDSPLWKGSLFWLFSLL